MTVLRSVEALKEEDLEQKRERLCFPILDRRTDDLRMEHPRQRGETYRRHAGRNGYGIYL